MCAHATLSCPKIMASSYAWSNGLDRIEAAGEPECVGLANDALEVEPGEVVVAETSLVDVVG
jgi:hypothetical protein